MYTYKPQEGVRSPIDGGCQEVNSGPLEEEPVFLTSEPSQEPKSVPFNKSCLLIVVTV